MASTATTRPRNAAATKERLLDAAAEEFAEHGLAGARIDRIAEHAGANKRLLYVYFGNKEAVFDAVLERHLTALVDAVDLDPVDLGAYAGMAFDYLLANPQTARLVAWRDFERAEPTVAERASWEAKLAVIRGAQRAGQLDDTIPAIDLLAIIQRLITSWLAAPIGLRGLAGADPMSARRLRQHRRSLVEAARRLTTPREAF